MANHVGATSCRFSAYRSRLDDCCSLSAVRFPLRPATLVKRSSLSVPGRREADDETIAASAERRIGDITQAEAEVVRILLDHLKDRVPQVLVGIKRRELESAFAEVLDGAIGEAGQVEVALLPA